MKHITIAIDGPAGAGKSTIAKEVASRLNILYIDTGAMYRAIAFFCIQEAINPKLEQEKLEKRLEHIRIQLNHDGLNQRILLNGQDITDNIRTQEVAKQASNVAVIRSVRIKLVELQRKMAQKNCVVMDGRDIGTYVLPNASLKVFLTASADERTKRRCNELNQKGLSYDFEKVRKEIQERDEQDISREFAPLKKAIDAIEIDTTCLSISEIVEKIIALV